MANLVKFWCNTKANYDLLAVKDPATVYFCSDTKQIFRGTVNYSVAVRETDTLPTVYGEGILYIVKNGENAGGWVDFGSGLTKVIDKYALVGGLTNASTTNSGLMTPEQVANLNLLLEGRNSVNNEITTLKTGKIDKVVGATSGNFAILDSEGNIADSGKNAISFSISLTESESDGFAKKYTFSQGGTEIGSIDIPKDMVISSGKIEEIADGTVIHEGEYLPAGKYLVLTISNDTSDKIYIPVTDLASVYTGGTGITIDSNNVISVKVVQGNGLVLDENGIHLALATQKEAGALSAVDKVKIDTLDKVYTKSKYNVLGIGEGCLVDYRDHTVRVMFPADYQFTKQNGGEGSSPNMHYYAFRVYVPDETVWIANSDKQEGSEFDGELFETRVSRGFAGYDNGRKYMTVWLAAAMTSDDGASWTYFGATSDARKVGNWIRVKAYSDAEQTNLIYSDIIRVCLENETSWEKPIDQFGPILSVDTSNGLTLDDYGKLGFDSSFITIDGSNVKVDNVDGESVTLEAALEEIYDSVVWKEL